MLLLGFLLVLVCLYLLFKFWDRERIQLRAGSKLASIVSKMPTLVAGIYEYPKIWGRFPFLQDVYCAFVRQRSVTIARKRCFLDDVACKEPICYDTFDCEQGAKSNKLLIVFPGITGTSESIYSKTLISEMQSEYHVVVFNRPGCAEPLRQHEYWLNSHVNTVHHFLTTMANMYATYQIYLVGHSMGGQNIVRYLGDASKAKPANIVAAVTIGHPYAVHDCVKNLAANSFYDTNYVKLLLNLVKKNENVFLAFEKSQENTHGFDFKQAMQAKSLGQVDELLTKRVHKYNCIVEDYYKTRSITEEHLQNVQVPLFILHALDDIVVPEEHILSKQHCDNPNIAIAWTRHGGHCSFLRAGSFLFNVAHLSLQDALTKEFFTQLQK